MKTSEMTDIHQEITTAAMRIVAAMAHRPWDGREYDVLRRETAGLGYEAKQDAWNLALRMARERGQEGLG